MLQPLFASYLCALLAIFFWGCNPAPQEDAKTVALKRDVYVLANDSLEGRAIGTPGAKRAADYIVKRFRDDGLIPHGAAGYYQPFSVKSSASPHRFEILEKDDSTAIKGYNIVGMIDNEGDDIIVIGAHYDHLGYGGEESLYSGDSAVHNGADDNASGIALMLLLAHGLKQHNMTDDVAFIAFSGEEKGLWGSAFFCKNPTVDLKKVDAMINLDMVGRLDNDRGVAIYGTGTSPAWDSLIAKANTDSLRIVSKPSGIGPSDHTSFYLRDIPVLHFFTGQHEDYHRPGDDAEKINYAGILKIESLIERIVVAIDGRPERLAFAKNSDGSGERPRFSVTLGVMPDYLFEGPGMRIAGVNEKGAARQAGVEKDDIVMAIGDVEVTDMNSYMKALAAFKKGDKTTVRVKRKEHMKNFSITF